MAQFTRTHGDFKPVLWLDQPDYTTGAVNAVSSALTVQPQGPKLDFFTIELADVAANTTIALQTIQCVQQLATIHIYEFTDTTTDTLALAVYPTGAWNTVSLAAAVDAATGGTSTVTAEATFTN
jgi:hypothetical protein